MLTKLKDWFGESVAIDLGTENTVVVKNGDVIISEPTVIAYDSRVDGKFVGKKALALDDRTPRGVKVIWPMASGKISDPTAVEDYLSAILERSSGKLKRAAKRQVMNSQAAIAISCDLNDVGINAVVQTGKRLGYNVELIYQPVAAALSEVDLEKFPCILVIDIGHGTTDIIFVTEEGVFGGKGHSIDVAGKTMDLAIQAYVAKKKQGASITLLQAQQIKHSLGSALPGDLDNECYMGFQGYTAEGTAKPFTVTSGEVYEILKPIVRKIQEHVYMFLGQLAHAHPGATTIATSSARTHQPVHKQKNTVLLAGGVSQLPKLDKFFSDGLSTKHLKLAARPMEAAALGAWRFLNDERFRMIYEVKRETWELRDSRVAFDARPLEAGEEESVRKPLKATKATLDHPQVRVDAIAGGAQ